MVTPGFSQPLTEMTARNIPGGKVRLARKAGDFRAKLRGDCLKNVGVSTLTNPWASKACYRESLTFI
jgi:hypothetical protein